MDILALCAKLDNAYLLLQTDLMGLEGYAVMFRYPGQSANKDEAKAAFKSAMMVKAFVKNQLGL
jgi:hypothetical protein